VKVIFLGHKNLKYVLVSVCEDNKSKVRTVNHMLSSMIS